jgi:hypothetical protein
MPRKKKEVVLSPEQQWQAKLNAFLEHDAKFIPEPTYYFNIGDKVEIGNLNDVSICNIINDKIYEIDYSTIRTKLGEEIRQNNLVPTLLNKKILK